MPGPSFILLYVDNPAASARFYTALLGAPPAEASANFAIPLAEGAMLGLWARHDVAPAAEAAPGATELAFTRASAAEVDATHADWAARGIPILQAPRDADFGRNFLAADPDGHRLRVFAPA